MAPSDLLALHRRCQRQRLLLSFDGPLSQGLVEALGLCLREHMRARGDSQARTTDVFSVYVEMTQNACHYIDAQGYLAESAHAAVAIGQDEHGRYVICCGNPVEPEDGRRLMDTLAHIARLDPPQLKAAYKTRLRQPRDPRAGRGAGLGLLDIAGKARAPLSASLTPQAEGHAFFSLCSTI